MGLEDQFPPSNMSFKLLLDKDFLPRPGRVLPLLEEFVVLFEPLLLMLRSEPMLLFDPILPASESSDVLLERFKDFRELERLSLRFSSLLSVSPCLISASLLRRRLLRDEERLSLLRSPSAEESSPRSMLAEWLLLSRLRSLLSRFRLFLDEERLRLRFDDERLGFSPSPAVSSSRSLLSLSSSVKLFLDELGLRLFLDEERLIGFRDDERRSPSFSFSQSSLSPTLQLLRLRRDEDRLTSLLDEDRPRRDSPFLR